MKVNKLISLLLLSGLSLSLVACGSSDKVKDETAKENASETAIHGAEKNADEYLKVLTEGEGLSPEELKEKPKVSAETLETEISDLVQRTRDSQVIPNTVSLEDAQLATAWLSLVNKTEVPDNNPQLASTLKKVLSSFSEEDQKIFLEKMASIKDIAERFCSGNTAVVGLIRESGVNPNDIPFDDQELGQWFDLFQS